MPTRIRPPRPATRPARSESLTEGGRHRLDSFSLERGRAGRRSAGSSPGLSASASWSSPTPIVMMTLSASSASPGEYLGCDLRRRDHDSVDHDCHLTARIAYREQRQLRGRLFERGAALTGEGRDRPPIAAE